MNKATPWIVLLVLAVGLSAWYFYRPESPEQHPSVVTLPSTAEPVTAPPPARFPVERIPMLEELPAEPLPSLEESDSAVIEALAGLLGAESLGHYFVLERLIGRFVATVDSLDSRQVAPLVMPTQPIGGKFLVSEGEVISVNPDNAQRYSALVSLVSSLDTGRVVGQYLRFYPLFQEAYSQLGRGDAYFNDRLVEVINHLLETPRVEGDLVLIKPESVFLFADPGWKRFPLARKYCSEWALRMPPWSLKSCRNYVA